MSCEILQIKKTNSQLLVAFKLRDRNSTNTGDEPLEKSSHMGTALYIIFCLINQCDLKLKIDGEGIEKIRQQFIGVYGDHRANHIGKVFFKNTAFSFDYDVNNGETKIKCLEW